MRKNYVLDTNVLIHDPNAVQHFQDNTVVIPLKVIEEVDQFKRDLNERGRNARLISRILDDLRQHGKLSDGVPVSTGGTLRVAIPGDHDINFFNSLSADDQILKMATQLKKQEPHVPCIVVSKDINLRIKADALGLDAEDYETDRVDLSELYTGHSELDLGSDDIETFRRDGRLPTENTTLSPNEYVMLRDIGDGGHTFLSRYDSETRSLVQLIPLPEELRTVQPRNKEQHFAADSLLNDNIKVVTIIGKAGTGKTLLAVAAALFKTMEEKHYRRMLVCRPTIPMGKDIGFLPGTMEEKLNPWMQPIYDALDFLSNGRRAGWKRGDNEIDDERIGIEPLTYIRGRSIPNQYIVVDEAQNLTPLEAKTVLTRVGPGTKIVLTGDIYQIDNPYVDAMSNGLSYIVERFRDQPIASHILLARGVRSEVAELAANLL